MADLLNVRRSRTAHWQPAGSKQCQMNKGQPDNGAYIGKGVTFRGSISAPEAIIVEGTIEGDVTAQTVRIGVGGTIRG